jgi:arabinogalactan oligomer/maltooligosaccharide transport system permease protein
MNPIARFFYKLYIFVISIPGKIWNGLKAAARGIRNFVFSVGRGFKNYGKMFAKGDAFTRISFVVVGFGCIVRKQVVKGIIFLLVAVLLLYFIFSFGWQFLRDLGTLGTNAGDERINPDTGLIEYSLPDNSMLILLYSVMTLLVILLFIALYYASVSACYKAQMLKKDGKPLPTFREEVRYLLNEKYHITLLSLPTILAALFVVLPLVFMILIAFTNFDRNHQPPGNLFTWVGLDNFGDVFGSNPSKSYTFRHLLQWTVIWAVIATVTNYILGMLLAMLINKKGVRLKKLWRTVFVLTIAVPQFVSLLLMRRLFDDQGTVNIILEKLFGTTVNFLSNATNARIMVILINVWVGVPYSMLITSGILMNIPQDLYESARIDGANPVKTFTKITLPYMLFVTAPYLITQFVGNFNNFNVIYLLTQGDPGNVRLYQAGDTDLLVTWLYKLTVNFQDYNLASVIGILVFVISAVLSLIVYNSSSSAKSEEEFQ